jgi:hypothetical protein
MKAVFFNPGKVTVEGRGGGGFPWEAVALVLVLAAVGGVAHAVAPYVHLLWEALVMCAILAGCGLLALAGKRFAQWQDRRRPEPEGLRWRDGQQIREPRR